MDPGHFNTIVVQPGLDLVFACGGPKPTDEAARFLLAVAMQESGANLDARYQNSPGDSPGPARGFWQFEQGGGVAGVLSHGASKDLAAKACAQTAVVAKPAAVWRTLEGHGALAAVFARLLLLTDPQSVPTEERTGWDCYLRLWHPGKPHPETWAANWNRATQVIYT